MLNFFRQHRSIIFFTLLGCLLSGLAFYAQFAAGDAPSSHRTLMMWSGTLSTSGVVGIGAIQAIRVERRNNRLLALSADYQTKLHDVLDVALRPLSRTLAELSAATSQSAKRQKLGSVHATALLMAAHHASRHNVPIATEGARASLYLLDPTGTRLVLEDSRGRSNSPRAVFDLSSSDGLYMKKTLDDGIPLLMDGKTILKRFPTSQPVYDYESVIVARIQANGNPGSAVGLLCIDSPKAEDLNEAHRAFAEVLANIIGAAHAQA
ncbi:GAF domain-containing protein [Streptomyces sp. NPDC058084]|uniref:GAF domain-containing protein n=1 Tax=Streptomyces sp. NPDC058084 TaxID=3346333 RepID=UPI0036E8490C